MEPYQPKILFDSLKAAVKAKGFRYADIASALHCSESTIKHMFHGIDAPVSRVIEICDVIGVSFPDLISLSGDYATHFVMTEEQETFFAENLPYYEFFRKVFFDRMSPAEVRREHKLDERSLRRYLRGLEQIGLLDILPGDKLSFKVSGMQQFIPGGPLMRRYMRDFSAELTEIVESDMTHPDQLGQFGYFSLTTPAYQDFLHDLGELIGRYKKRAHREFIVGRNLRQTPVSWFFGVVPQRLKCFYNSVIPRL
jgi:transcriptional regulator with XRE-family HTH domain